MYSNTFRKLRPLTCVSPAQPVCASEMPRLRPQPPPQTHPEGIAKELARQNRIIMREMSPISSRPQSVKLPPIFGSSHARGLCPHPPAQRKTPTLVEYGIRADQRKAELSRQIRYDCYLANMKATMCTQAQHIPQNESAISEREMKTEKNRDNFKANLKPCLILLNAPEAKKAAWYVNRTQMKTEERKALERKVCEPKEESEELVLTEPEEFKEESKENIEWEFVNLMDEREQDNKLYQYEMKKMNKAADCIKEKTDHMRKVELKNSNLTEQKQERLKYLVERPKPDRICRRGKVRQLCEKMAEVYMESFGHFCSPDFPSIIMPALEDMSLDVLEDMQPETLYKLQKQLLKDYDTCDMVQKQAELEALQEERRQKRLERALAPPVKIIGKKLMPRSRPPKMVIKKEEPAETKNQE